MFQHDTDNQQKSNEREVVTLFTQTRQIFGSLALPKRLATNMVTHKVRTPVPLKRWAWLEASAPPRCFSPASSHHLLSITERRDSFSAPCLRLTNRPSEEPILTHWMTDLS
ncbi:hypothetical protein BaRGS_00028018 [Batillaria attramentaria]|uniref:Uncharacterized protein n=1 Tax=Batillaria attramentaria TaxID=370345 RepID=A0ABD0K0B7_9CAEN